MKIPQKLGIKIGKGRRLSPVLTIVIVVGLIGVAAAGYWAINQSTNKDITSSEEAESPFKDHCVSDRLNPGEGEEARIVKVNSASPGSLTIKEAGGLLAFRFDDKTNFYHGSACNSITYNSVKPEQEVLVIYNKKTRVAKTVWVEYAKPKD